MTSPHVTRPARIGSVVGLVIVVVLFAVTTMALGWWTVPLVAALLGAFVVHPRVPYAIALAASLSWAALLTGQMFFAPVGTVARDVSSIMHIPTLALVALTLLFPGVLAWSAERLSAGLTPRLLATFARK